MPKVKVNDIQMYYELHGQGDPFVCISGTGFNGQTWKPYQVPEFSSAYQVLIFDHRGTGESDKPDGPYSTRMFADDLAGLMDALGLSRAHVLGHSMGGRVAQHLALDYPDKVRTLILAGSGSGQYDRSRYMTRGIPVYTCLELVEKGYERYMEDHIAGEFFFSPDFVREHPEVVQKAKASYSCSPTPLKNYLLHVIARQEHETTDRLGEIKAPTLVMVGGQDRVVGGTGDHFRAAEVLAERIPNAKFVVVKGARHAFLWEDPAQTHKLIWDFIKRF